MMQWQTTAGLAPLGVTAMRDGQPHEYKERSAEVTDAQGQSASRVLTFSDVMLMKQAHEAIQRVEILAQREWLARDLVGVNPRFPSMVGGNYHVRSISPAAQYVVGDQPCDDNSRR